MLYCTQYTYRTALVEIQWVVLRLFVPTGTHLHHPHHLHLVIYYRCAYYNNTKTIHDSTVIHY